MRLSEDVKRFLEIEDWLDDEVSLQKEFQGENWQGDDLVSIPADDVIWLVDKLRDVLGVEE